MAGYEEHGNAIKERCHMEKVPNATKDKPEPAKKRMLESLLEDLNIQLKEYLYALKAASAKTGTR
jgi:hypothetical protein